MNVFFIKLCGCATLAAAAAHSAFIYKYSLQKRLFFAQDLLKFVRFASDAIKHRSLPVAEILREYAETSGTDWGQFYYSAAETSLHDAFEKNGVPDERTKAIMLDFSSEFGRGYIDSEIRLCELTAARLAEQCATLETATNKKISVFRASIIFAVASLILLII